MWETARLAFRRFSSSDADALYHLDADPEVMRFITGGRSTPRAIVEGQILPGFVASYDRVAFGMWAALTRGGGDFVGWVGLRPYHGDPAAGTLGYRLRRAFWGRGLATEAARALIAAAFDAAALDRVTATTYEHNLASRRVLEKAGMRLVRRFRPTAAELSSAGTFDPAGAAVWDGDELEYAVNRQGRWARP